MHDHDTCPYEPAEDDSPEVRLDRPNHFFHDIGCPFECTDRHNHPIKA